MIFKFDRFTRRRQSGLEKEYGYTESKGDARDLSRKSPRYPKRIKSEDIGESSLGGSRSVIDSVHLGDLFVACAWKMSCRRCRGAKAARMPLFARWI